MKILQVITSFDTGGAEMLVAGLVPLLQEKGYIVDVAIFQGFDTPLKSKLEKSGCHIYNFSNRGNVYNPLIIPRLVRLMRNYDIVHTHNTAPQLFAAIASVFTHTALCTTEHNTTNRRRNYSFYKPVDRWMYGRYKKIICISSKALDNLEQHLSPCHYNTIYIPNGIDLKIFHNAKSDKELANHGDKFAVVMVAKFRPQKDQDTIIRAMALLPADGYELWLCGDGERRAELEQLTRQGGVADRVKFLGVRTDIPAILHAADAVVMSSHFEGLSLSSIEGMAVGKPFIASDVDGLHDITSGAGLLFPHGDAKALASILRKLRADDSLVQSVASACYERANSFDIQHTADGYAKVYDEIYNAKKKQKVLSS